MAEGRKQFTFYRSYYEAIKVLPKKEQTAVILAICAYALDGEEPKLTGTAQAIFSLVRPTLDASKRKAESGAAGGRQKANDKQNESKPEANGKQSAREKEKEKEGEIEIEKENECYTPLPPTQGKKAKHKHGEYKNVLLTDEELDKLKGEYTDWSERIERLSSYIESTGKKYKSHYATIRNWARKDGEKNGESERPAQRLGTYL